ncbi:MAG: beta-N-acetylhexosaminidase [Porticoccaceae bacterium]|nr:beta-N-acetylhexosaminidase [Porticoccaceae bacterium]
MIDLIGTQLEEEELGLLQNPQVGGVILFSRNFEDRTQLADLVSSIRQITPELLIAVDQEGGRVQRFRMGFTPIPPMQKIGDVVINNQEKGLILAHETGWLMASEILACGLDFSFAPVLDIDRNSSKIIGDRAFSDRPEIVCLAAGAFIQGMRQAGMSSVGKHFPGHGGVIGDSHLEAPIDTRVLKRIANRDLLPYAQLSKHLGGIMPAHITYSSIDERSVGFSHYWLHDILRTQMGFEGVIFSDDLSMKGADIAGGFVEKASLALNAGCDMILVCNDRAGVIEVLRHMEAAGYSKSSRIGRMSASVKPSWDDLASQTRYQKIVAHLSEL